MADALAREGSSTQFHGKEPYFPIPLSTMKRDISSLFNREHEKRWASIDSCSLSKTTMPCRDEKRTRFFLNLRRNCLRVLLGMLTGHSMLNHHLHRMKVKPSPTCELCLMEEETVTYFQCLCPKLQQHRLHYILGSTSSWRM